MLTFDIFICDLSTKQVCLSKLKQENLLNFFELFVNSCLFYAVLIWWILMAICICLKQNLAQSLPRIISARRKNTRATGENNVKQCLLFFVIFVISLTLRCFVLLFVLLLLLFFFFLRRGGWIYYNLDI